MTGTTTENTFRNKAFHKAQDAHSADDRKKSGRGIVRRKRKRNCAELWLCFILLDREMQRRRKKNTNTYTTTYLTIVTWNADRKQYGFSSAGLVESVLTLFVTTILYTIYHEEPLFLQYLESGCPSLFMSGAAVCIDRRRFSNHLYLHRWNQQQLECCY